MCLTIRIFVSEFETYRIKHAWLFVRWPKFLKAVACLRNLKRSCEDPDWNSELVFKLNVLRNLSVFSKWRLQRKVHCPFRGDWFVWYLYSWHSFAFPTTYTKVGLRNNGHLGYYTACSGTVLYIIIISFPICDLNSTSTHRYVCYVNVSSRALRLKTIDRLIQY